MELSYKQNQDAAIRDLLQKYDCQPILFVGAGLSKRYWGAPSWEELLKNIHSRLPTNIPKFEYFMQKNSARFDLVGEEISRHVFEWAWNDGHDLFPSDLFEGKVNKHIYIKHMACEIINETSKNQSSVRDTLIDRELSSLSSVRPHAVITTNYDLFLEGIFQGYEPISGQTILRYNANSFGEIFHIHGDASHPASIVLTESDYKEWSTKKKYISAKLLTYFAEHPVFIIGYSVSDPNVKSILCDIAEIISEEDGLIDNIFHIIWDPDAGQKARPEVSTINHEDKEYQIRAIYTDDFRWIYEALKSKTAIPAVNPKLIRALAARTFKLIRTDIPSGNVEVDYHQLEKVASETDYLPNLLGITTGNNPNISHPYTLTQIAKQVQLNSWQRLNPLLNKIKEEKGVDLRSSDNKYHCRVKTGDRSSARKWSPLAISLFRTMLDGGSYEIDL